MNETTDTLPPSGGPSPAPLSSGADRIAAERRRQIEVEGWKPEDDTGYVEGQLLRAAEVYTRVARLGYVYAFWHKDWPWDASWFKPGKLDGGRWEVDADRCLAKAGALIAADMDRRTADFNAADAGAEYAAAEFPQGS